MQSRYMVLRGDARKWNLESRPKTPAANKKNVEVVLDINWEGSVIGMEVIGLLSQTSPHAIDGLEAIETAERLPLTWSFDAKSDAFYLRLRRERSVEQPLREAVVWLDQEGKIVKLEVDADDPAP